MKWEGSLLAKVSTSKTNALERYIDLVCDLQ